MVNVNNLTSIATTIGSNNPILDNVSCRFLPSLITVIVGKSGSGKTTLLRSIAQLERVSSGTVSIDNQFITNIPPQERAQLLGFVFQNYNLFPHMTVLQNCLQPLILTAGLSYEMAKEKVVNELTVLDMIAYQNAYPGTLSGGQKQRVALARALCLGPKVLLLDEPTSALDQENSMIIVRLLKKLSREGMTIIVTSHDRDFLSVVQDAVLEIVDNDIREVSVGTQ